MIHTPHSQSQFVARESVVGTALKQRPAVLNPTPAFFHRDQFTEVSGEDGGRQPSEVLMKFA
jgi:hypothetical protein